MLLSINFISTDSSPDKIFYHHSLVDKEYKKSFVLVDDRRTSAEVQRITIINGILNFIHQNYRSSSECPFINIQNLYNKDGFGYNDSEFRKTEFYAKHSKVMDKILKPEAIAPVIVSDGYTIPSTTTFTTGSYYTYTINVPLGNVGWYTANASTTDGYGRYIYGAGGGGGGNRRGGR